MGIFDSLKQEAQRNFIARADEAKDELIYKYPERNIRVMTQLTVQADEMAMFVKDGEEFVRVSTNVLKDDGTRAIGTQLARNKAYEAISKGNLFCGDVEILGSPYDTCYEPIKDAAGKILGAYYVGFKK